MTNETRPTISFEVKEEERWRRRLQVTVPADRVSDERRKVTERVASRMKLPGFREGRVPSDVVEKRHEDAIRQQVLDTVIEEAYSEALRRAELRPISPGSLESVDYEPGEDLTFAIAFDVQPEIEIGRIGGFQVERPGTEVGEDEVEKVLRRLQEENAVWEPAEGKPEDGDMVSVRIAPVEEDDDDGEPRPYEFVLGQGDAIPDVEEAIKTLEPGEDDVFEITFPHDFPDEDRRGVSRSLRITLEDRKLQNLPDPDDDFARTLGDFEGIEEIRETIREDLEAEARREAEAAVRRELVENLVEANPFEVPESMVDRYVEQVMGNAREMGEEERQQARAAIRPDATRAVKRALLVDHLARTQGLEATDEAVDARVREIAEENDRTPAEVRAQLRENDRLEALRRNMTEEKVFDFLRERSEVVEADA